MKVAIAGYGIEGKANYAYWGAQGAELTIVDEKPITDVPAGAAVITGEGVYSQLDGYDLVVRTAGLNPSKIQTSGKIWSGTNEFFAHCPAPIIGVTGTKGKGTTASLIASIIREAGRTVHLVGNIGLAALEVLPLIKADDIVVYELSSFQLWDLERSPHVAVVLMIEDDHLDVHSHMDEYLKAKANIRRHQTVDDICFVHPTNSLSAVVAHTSSKGQVRRYGVPDDGAVYVKSNTFFVQDTTITGIDTLQLAGAHNLENACAAISAARVYTTDISAIESGLRLFSGLPHRLKRVATVGGVTYYNDSIATTPGSAIAALQAFSEPKVIILGGRDKGAKYEELIASCAQTGSTVVAIGENGGVIRTLCEAAGVPVHDMTGHTMRDIVQKARELALPGGVVILSPAASSFDMFESYADRGDQFVTAVEGLS